ncbi:MAG TPA: PIN domain-containing protein [Candidatus Dormibacteraeota bacterium]|nr:PIN domain-containing protein [Candidatus Dormibacteraeota bacterium]
MRYLLDVNTLLALFVLQHEFHARVASWVKRLGASGVPELATCSITELGFVRVLGQAQQYGSSVAQARELLLKLKNSDGMRWIFISDDRDISHLPRWVRTPKQTTDGHLAELARANEAVLATLDRRISGAFVIPQTRQS